MRPQPDIEIISIPSSLPSLTSRASSVHNDTLGSLSDQTEAAFLSIDELDIDPADSYYNEAQSAESHTTFSRHSMGYERDTTALRPVIYWRWL